MTSRRWLWIILMLAVAGCKPSAPPSSNVSELAAVMRGCVEKSITSAGKVVSNLDVDIKCRASGEVITLPFDIKDSVIYYAGPAPAPKRPIPGTRTSVRSAICAVLP